MIVFKPHESLGHMRSYLPENPIIIEAGAFDGHDTKRIAAMWPHSTIHAFEPVPTIFKKLRANTQHLPNVQCHQFALSDQSGTATLYVSESPKHPGTPSQANSLRKPKKRLKLSPLTFPHTIQVPTITLDAWAAQNNIDHVDLLLLDMQGHELNVLQASSAILPTVSVVHTEVSFVESYENQPRYHDVKTWLEQNGFTMIGRDFPEPPKWFFGNALFVRK